MAGNRKMGRPSGTTADTRLVAEADLPRCPRCKSTNLKVFKSLRSQEFGGVHAGQPYNRITRKRMHCEGCGAYPVLKTYHYSGDVPPKK